MPVTCFQSQQAAETPIAPLSSQQAAVRYEPSVQGFVTELGGYTIPELEHFIDARWKTNFSIAKVSLIRRIALLFISKKNDCYSRLTWKHLLCTQVWKAFDAISDKGLHSYLQHHWVIIKLVPSESQDGSSVAAKGDVSGDTELPTSSLSPDLHSRIVPEVQELQATPDKSVEEDAVRAKELVNCDTIDESSSAEAISKRQKISPQQGQGNSPALINEVQQPQRSRSSETPDHKESEQADEEQQPDLKMSTEQQLNVEQTQQLQPHDDHGLNLADRGSPWFLRIDRQA